MARLRGAVGGPTPAPEGSPSNGRLTDPAPALVLSLRRPLHLRRCAERDGLGRSTAVKALSAHPAARECSGARRGSPSESPSRAAPAGAVILEADPR